MPTTKAPNTTENKLIVKALPAGFIHESEALAREVIDLTIDSDVEFEYWAERSRAGNALVKKIEEYHDSTRDQAYRLWKSIVKLIEDSTAPIKRSVSVIDRALIDYRRKKLEAAEAQRRLLQEQADKQHDELVLAEAQQLQDQGDPAGADLVLAAGADSKPVVAIQDSAPPKVAGFGFRKGWDFEIVDATGKVVEDSMLLPREYLMPNEQAIRKVVSALGDKARIPGVRVKEKESTTKRRS